MKNLVPLGELRARTAPTFLGETEVGGAKIRIGKGASNRERPDGERRVRETVRIEFQTVERRDHFAIVSGDMRVGAAVVAPQSFGAPDHHEIHETIAGRLLAQGDEPRRGIRGKQGRF